MISGERWGGWAEGGLYKVPQHAQWGFRNGGSWTGLSPCGAEAPHLCFHRNTLGLEGQSQTQHLACATWVAWAQSCRPNDRQWRMTKKPWIGKSFLTEVINYKNHWKQSIYYQPLVYRETCACLIRLMPRLPLSFYCLKYLLNAYNVLSFYAQQLCDIPTKQIFMSFSSAQCSIYNILLDATN